MAADANLIRAIRGPVTLITLGVLFSFDHFTRYSFTQTWPILLIVFGLLSLLRRGTHPRFEPPSPVAPPWPPPPADRPWPPPPSSVGSGYTGGGYRKSPYGAASGPESPNPGGTPGSSTGGSQ
jgi:hypothetical protein